MNKRVRLLYGIDVMEGLKQLENESVDCCITSPPYWGLRDYGTANWQGGDEQCEHTINHYSDTLKPDCPRPFRGDRSICIKCEAVRIDSQIGLENTPEEYTSKMLEVFEEVKRLLKSSGTLWLNLGDSYAGAGIHSANHANPGISNAAHRGADVSTPVPPGLKPKDLVGIPWRVAFALQKNGWWLRQDIIWSKPNPMPESVKDRCTKSHEYIFLLTKRQRYYFDYENILEEATGYDGRKEMMMKGSPKYANGFVPTSSLQTVAVKGHERWRKRKNIGTNYGGDGTGFQDHSGYNNLENPYVRNKRSVWTVTTTAFKGAHFATFPEELIEPMILAGCPKDGTILDCFAGTSTTGKVAVSLGRKYIGIDLNKNYEILAKQRLGLHAL